MPKAAVSSSHSSLMQTYFLYSAILALKLLALKPLSAFLENLPKLQRANISDLKNLTPFWLVAALYMTTSPDEATAVALMRAYVVARFIAAYGYIHRIPKLARNGAFFVSFGITCYMGATVVYTYKNAL